MEHHQMAFNITLFTFPLPSSQLVVDYGFNMYTKNGKCDTRKSFSDDLSKYSNKL